MAWEANKNGVLYQGKSFLHYSSIAVICCKHKGGKHIIIIYWYIWDPMYKKMMLFWLIWTNLESRIDWGWSVKVKICISAGPSTCIYLPEVYKSPRPSDRFGKTCTKYSICHVENVRYIFSVKKRHDFDRTRVHTSTLCKSFEPFF